MEESRFVVKLNALGEITVVGGFDGFTDFLFDGHFGLAILPFDHGAATLTLVIKNGVDG